MSANSQNIVATSGDSSPAVIARDFSATYGVRSDAIIEILSLYEHDGYDLKSRKNSTEKVLKRYLKSPEKENNRTELSDSSKVAIGIDNKPEISNALEWDLYSRKNHLKTIGDNSPAIIASGNVNIWYGIPSKTLRALASLLEKNKSKISNFEEELKGMAKKYIDLKKELDTYANKDEIYNQAVKLLKEGELEEAEELIENDFEASKKRQAYKGFVLGQTKDLLNKFYDAEMAYKNAIDNDPTNIGYLQKYAKILKTLGNNEASLEYNQKALFLLENGDVDKTTKEFITHKALILMDIGYNYHEIEKFDLSIKYHEDSQLLIQNLYDDNHMIMSYSYINLGVCWDSKKEFDKAIGYYELALDIIKQKKGDDSLFAAQQYINIGVSYSQMGEIDSALKYYNKAEMIYVEYAKGSPMLGLAQLYADFALTYNSLGEYNKALEYMDKAEFNIEPFFKSDHKDKVNNYRIIYGINRKKALELNNDKNFVDRTFYLENALKYSKLLENNDKIINSLINLGLNYNSLTKYDKALENYDMALLMLSNIEKTTENKKIKIDILKFKEDCRANINSDRIAKEMTRVLREKRNKKN